MSSVQSLREFVTERLTAAAAEIFGVFEKTIVEYEEEIDRQRRLLDMVWKPEIKLHRLEHSQKLVCQEDEVLSDQQFCNQEKNSNLDQEDPDSPQIKEEQEKFCTSLEGEQLVLKQETDDVMLIPTYEESYCSQPEPISGRQLLSHSSTVPELIHDKEGSKHVDSGSTRNTETKHFISHSDIVNNSSMSELVPYVCNTCGKKFMEKYRLRRHTRIHTGEKPYPCHTCGKSFTDNSSLRKHTLIHTGEKPYPCHICGKRFRENFHLKRHLIVHTGEKTYSCDICGKKFWVNSHLKKHLTVHTGERPYSCHTCGKKFREKSQCKRHLVVHTGEKPYSCDTCGKRFRVNSELKNHLVIHTGEKPFSCDICGKKFSQSSVLSGHLKIHADEKPYLCSTCGKQFYRMTHVKKHMLTHIQ